MNECEICGELIDLEAQWLVDPICSACYNNKQADDCIWDDLPPEEYFELYPEELEEEGLTY